MTEKQAEKIIFLLTNLLILEAKKQNLRSEDVRDVLKINNNEISKVWRLKTVKDKKGGVEK
jgi:hypothetical protein